jgi:aspartate/methionine/tyrosine aminotransferase
MVDRLRTIPGISCVLPKGAFYVFPNVTRTGHSSRDLADLLLEGAGVACVAGTAFGESGEGYIRFSYANSLENLEEALRRIQSVLA